jgi:hypothetical protein
MSYSILLQSLGFNADPFAKTNADEEDQLGTYFIQPPFFQAVYGDLLTPKSVVVFAPRGGGKTALKRMLEVSSQSDPFLCVTYNYFSSEGLTLEQIDIRYHLRNIARLVLVSVLTGSADRGVDKLSHDDRRLLYLLTKAHLSDLDTTDLAAAIAAAQNFSDKAKKWWNAFAGPIGFAINTVLSRIGLQAAEIDRFATAGGNLGQLTEQIALLGRLALKLDFKCIYVLIDKIDEIGLTGGKAGRSFEFIQPLVCDLQVLELRNFGFKFFLWDMLQEKYQEFARPDRVKLYNLEWSPSQLREMLSRRLAAYSDGAVKSFTAIVSADEEKQFIDVDTMMALLGKGSPRNIIRLCKEIFDQQSEISGPINKIDSRAFARGFEVFSKNYATESLPANVLDDLRKLKRADFTAKYVYNEVFKVTQQAGISKINTWQDRGIVERVGMIQETKGARSSNHYAITSPLVLKYVFSEMNVYDFYRSKMRVCECGQLLLRDWDLKKNQVCHTCQREIELKM